MEPFSMLSPNTAAFLDSIALGDVEQSKSNAGLPPSVFFPMPGRDTPEDSSPDSIADKAKNVSDDSDSEVKADNSHKRKAHGANDHLDEEDEYDSLSDNGHEDKRQHGNDKKGGRRRSSKEEGKDKKPGKDNLTKAQRRKEQNRAAQKAFRERREAKVRDLEEMVAELEAKSFGATVENENLRGILRRLQEENVALKNAHFTFNMPVNGQASTTTSAPSGQQTPTTTNLSSNTGIDWSSFSNFKAQPQVTKPPSPPHSVSNDSLRSINETSPAHRGSVGSGIGNSPESLVSISGPSPSTASDRTMPSLFSGLTSSNPMINRHNSSSSASDILSTPSSIGGTNKEDVEALFRSLYPNGIDAVLAGANNTNSSPQPPTFQSPYTVLNTQPALMSYAETSTTNYSKLYSSMSYRDPSANSNNASFDTTAAADKTATASDPLAAQAAWAGVTDNSVSEFLASLSGANNDADLSGTADDDAFSRQIEALLSAQGAATSPSAAFNVPNSAFSPTNYLNMSPSPMQSLSNSQTPHSTTGSSSVTSPQTDASSVSGDSAICRESGVVHVIGDDGRVMRPSEVWTKMGLHNTSDPGEVMIDDLCDQMRSKATCKDGRRYMNYEDIEGMVKSREEKGTSRFGTRATSDADVKPDVSEDCAKKAGYHDPVECQARLNAAFLEANGSNGL